MINLAAKVDSRKLKARMKGWMKKIAQEEVEAVKDYGNIFVGLAFKWTPPGGAYYQGTEAKNRQENRIRLDVLGDEYGKPVYYKKGGVLHAFSPRKGYTVSPFVIVDKADVRRGVQVVDPRRHLNKFTMKRRSNGKYLAWHGPRPFVLRQPLMAEYRRRLRRVGRLAAGWVPAARFCGRKSIPGWIRRNAGKEGRACIRRRGENTATLIMYNTVPYHQDQTQRLIDGVLDGPAAAAIKKRASARQRALFRNLATA